MLNYSHKCLKNLRLNPASDNVLYQTAFPVQFAVTVMGNILTLSVLLSPCMRNRANHLLAALAFSDIAVFVFMLPTSLASFPPFYESLSFRIFFAFFKSHFAAVANWFSCAAIWIVLAVSIERLLIIKFPFRSLKPYHTIESVLIILSILGVTFCLTSYHHFSHKCILIWMCNMTQVYVQCLPVTWNWSAFGLVLEHQPSDAFVSYIHSSVIINALFGVIVPVFMVALLNISLIRLLHIRYDQGIFDKSISTTTGTLAANHQEQERKITITVVAIISCFTISQLPSALLFLYEKLVSDAKTKQFATVSCITNFLVLTGKMLNVVLFCLTSTSFRRKFLAIINVWVHSLICRSSSAGGFAGRGASNRSVTMKTSLAELTSSARNHGSSRRQFSMRERNNM